jgi:hypothetical protein
MGAKRSLRLPSARVIAVDITRTPQRGPFFGRVETVECPLAGGLTGRSDGQIRVDPFR